MQKITPFLWYDKEALQAAKFYKSLFPGSKTVAVSKIEGSPSGTVDVITIRILGRDVTLMSAGPLFKFTPAVSFMVACKSPARVNTLWRKLIQGGTPMMELGEYPFSHRYGWVQDRYGLSWQIITMKGLREGLTPVLMFTGAQAGKAEQAIKFYTSVFDGSSHQLKQATRYGVDADPDKPGTLKYAAFKLERLGYAAMDSAYEHGFGFNEAISFVVHCKDQKEVNYFWKKLSSDPQAEQCGWCKDRYGLSWQVVPQILDKLLASKDKAAAARVTQAFLQMKKFDIRALKRAHAGGRARR